MSRASRTAELLAALQLAPMEVEREQARARQQNATSRALASLVPALIEGGAGIAGDVIGAQKADALMAKKDAADERDALARIADRKATSDAQMARADAMKAKAEADKVKATTDAAEATRKAGEAARPQKIAGAAADVESEISMPGGVSQAQLEQIAVSRGLPATEWRTVLNERDANVDKLNKEALGMRKDAAAAGLAERKAVAPLGPRPKSAEEIERQRKKDELLDEQLKQLRGKPEATAAAQARDDAKLTTAQQEDVANIAASRRALKRITDEAAKVDPDLLSAAKNAALTTIGVDDKLTNYVAEVRNFNSAVGAMRSGASIGVAEQKRLDSFLIAPQDTVGTVEQKRRAFEEYLRDKEAGINAARRAQGLPAANLGDEEAEKPVSEMTTEEIEAALAGGR